MARARLRSFLRRFGGATEGATAIEFAFVAAPFLFMLFSIFEVGRLYTLNSVLEDATMDAGRLVRTGQAQESGTSADAFKDAVCERMSVFSGDCDTRLTVDVRVMPQFANQNPPDPVRNNGSGPAAFSEAEMTYNAGGPEDIVLIRTWWRQELFAPMITQGLARLTDGRAVLTAATTFRNEPYA